MARPKKTGLDYFPFDVDFFEDEKIVCIAGEFGLKGEIAAVKLLCAVYRNGYFAEWNDRLKMKMLRSLPGISPELLEQIVERLVKWDFFDKGLFDSAKILTSRGIQKRFLQASKRRKPDGGGEMEYMLEEICSCGGGSEAPSPADGIRMQKSRGRVSAYNNEVSACNNPAREEFLHAKTPQRKGKNNKETSLAGSKESAAGAPPPDALPLSLEDCYARLSANTGWKDTVAYNTRLSGYAGFTPQRLDAFLKAFFAKLQNEGVTHKYPRDAMSHFARWLKIELKGEHNERQQTRENDRDSRQRKLASRLALATRVQEAAAKRRAELEAEGVIDPLP